MASSGDQLPDSYGYNLHARLIGAVPDPGADLFLAIFFGIAYWAACAYGINKWLSKRKKDDVEIQPFKVSDGCSSCNTFEPLVPGADQYMLKPPESADVGPVLGVEVVFLARSGVLPASWSSRNTEGETEAGDLYCRTDLLCYRCDDMG